MSSEVQISSHNSHDKFVELSLDELLTRKNQGVNTTTEKVSYSEIGIPVIRANNILNGVIDYKDIVYVDEDTFARIKEPCKPRSGDILYTNIGSQFGNAAKVEADFEFAIAWNVMRLQPRNYIDSDFLMYLLNNPETKTYIRSLNSSSTMPFVSGKEIGKVKLKVPPIGTQRSISFILRAIDDRIALLRETNATLEAIAQALFKSWFVDFDPVHANAGTQAPSLPPEIQALFPATFTDSPHGPIPEGWEVKQLGEVTAYLNRGISPKYVETGGVVVINQKCIRDFAVDLSKARRHDPIQRKIDGRILEMGDILVNSTGVGTLGRVAQLLEVNETMIIDSHVTAVRANSELSWPYLGLALMRKQPEIEAMGEGTTGQTELARAKLAMLPIVCPPEEVLKVFDDIVTPLKKTLAANATKAENLSTLRDTLLPRLISGQLRLPEAEQAISAITD